MGSKRVERKLFTVLVLIVGAAILCSGCSVLQLFTGAQAVPLDNYEYEQHTPVYEHAGWTIARGSMHNHTTFSDGARSPEGLLEQARLEGIAVLAYNDHREGDIRIGPGLAIPINGIERVGYQTYFEEIGKVKESADDVIVLIGVEVVPYFYNVGKPPHFVVFNENHHFTVYNVTDPEVFENMPARRGIESLWPEDLIGTLPYQEFVDYFVDHGGIVHAVHIESTQDMWILGSLAHFIDRAHPELIRSIKNLSGFSVVPEAWRVTAAPGGDWDAAIIERLLGAREVTPWAMGDADYHGPKGSLTRGTTLFYMKEFTEAEVYRCLTDGRMVALMGELFQDCFVAEFSVSSGGAAKDPIMLGEEVRVSSPPVVRFGLDHDLSGVVTRLIRNGEVVKEVDGSSLEFVDRETFSAGLPAAYRVEVAETGLDRESDDRRASVLFTNPVFVYMDK